MAPVKGWGRGMSWLECGLRDNRKIDVKREKEENKKKKTRKV